MADSKQALAEFDALFADVSVPETITKPKALAKKAEKTADGVGAEKIAVINAWINTIENNLARPTGKAARANLSKPTANPDFVSVKLAHGPAGNLNVYFKGVWKKDHAIPAKSEASFWRATITLIESGAYDEVFSDALKRITMIFRNEDGTPKPRRKKEKEG